MRPRISGPVSYRPGDQVQCDLWFPPAQIPLGHGQHGSLPVLVMVASFSRFITATMIPTRDDFGSVGRNVGVDRAVEVGSATAVVKTTNLVSGGVVSWQRESQCFTDLLATRTVQLRPFDPESKGIVERANKYLETSFLPGRTFGSPTDFNDQLTDWLPLANARRVRHIGARPVDLIDIDRDGMQTLPTVAPHVGFSAAVRLPRDYYLRVLGNDYSADPTVIGPDDHRARRPAHRRRVLRRHVGRHPSADLGASADHHRPRARDDRSPFTGSVRQQVLSANR
jgi:hypothetical protein